MYWNGLPRRRDGRGTPWTSSFCKQFSSGRARTALLLTTLTSGAGGPTQAPESLRFSSALNQILKAGPPATTLTTGAVNGGPCHLRLNSIPGVFSCRADGFHEGSFSSALCVG